MEEQKTKTIAISWKDAAFGFFLPAILVGGLFGWGCFTDYRDEPGRDFFGWAWGCARIGAQIGGGCGLITFFLTLIVKDIVLQWKKR